MRAVASEFASPERSPKNIVFKQSQYFSEGLMFGRMLDQVPDMIMILNSDRQVVYANDAVLRAAGRVSMEEILGMRPGEVFGCTHSDETSSGCGTTRFCRYCGAVRSILEAQTGRFTVEECRMVVGSEAGERALDLRVWASPMTVRDEQFTFFVVVNIADEKRRFWLERVFLHDLMNTAMALRGFSGILTSGSIAPEGDQNVGSYISTLSGRIIDEIESHQQLVAAEHNELEVRVQAVNARQVLEDVCSTFSQPELLNGRTLRLARCPPSGQLESDKSLLVRVIGNMVKNAIEGSVPGEEVSVGCKKTRASIQFWVHNPTYIPENVRLQIFNRSFSTKGAGRGLGTYSMKLLTENYLGGKITFTSDEDKGTTFFATYPIRLKIS